MSHPVWQCRKHRLLGSPGGRDVSQEILMGTTAMSETLQSGRSDGGPCSGRHPPQTPPGSHAPTAAGADRGAAYPLLAARSV